ncbi:MAG: hypothetical protein MUP70_13760, partial [Candidatus Aminicenantes bacterium]|nr:hypothetical protein [Candidatus Aminicenantes bacterium]
RFGTAGGAGDLQLDNIFGSVTVIGTNRTDIKMTARKTIKARTRDRIQKAKNEVRLDITEEDRLIDIFVDGPFREKNQSKNKGDYVEHWDPGYRVHYDFTLEVPKKINLFIKTVTEGDVSVQNVEGDFEVRNVNGKILIDGIAGSGSAHTVNGGVTVHFDSNPKNDCSFKTINGDLELHFRNNLEADFWLKTFHGEAYTDFDYKKLPVKVERTEKNDDKGKYVYKSNHISGVRIGKGGPKITMDTLNGDLLIKRGSSHKKKITGGKK